MKLKAKIYILQRTAALRRILKKLKSILRIFFRQFTVKDFPIIGKNVTFTLLDVDCLIKLLAK